MFGYRAYIDGLRAIAVLAVLFFHADIGCSGGYVGVDVFFVISGYLITGLIMKEIDGSAFRILRFWERRILRIVPALAVVAVLCLIAGWIIFLPTDFEHMGKSVAALVMLVSNVFFWRSSGYFAHGATFQPLLHTWSLAVEEQFYLLFPGLMFILNRFARNYMLPVILFLCGLSLFVSVEWSYTHMDAGFYLLPTRAWELGIGALIALIPGCRPLRRWQVEALSWGGLLAIICAIMFYNSATRFPGVSALLPCVGTFAVIWANGNSPTSLGKLLSLRPLVLVGLISYSLYLWHWPILVFSKYSTFNPIPLDIRVLLLVISVALALLSWKYVETPFRKRIVLKSRSQIFAFAGVTGGMLLIAGLSIYGLHGARFRIPSSAMQYANGSTDRAFQNEVSLKQALAGDFIAIGSEDKRRPISLFVWGDSHAMAVMPVLDRLGRVHSVRGAAATHSSTCPAVGYESNAKYSLGKDSVAYSDAVVQFIRDKHIGNVVLVGFWDSYIDNDVDVTRVRESLMKTVGELRGAGARIWIMRQVPQQLCDNVPAALAVAVMFHLGDAENYGIPLAEHLKDYRFQDAIFEGLDKEPGVTVLNPTPFFVKSDRICRVAKNGRALYVDGHHLTVSGAMELRPLFEPIFKTIHGGRSPLAPAAGDSH